MWVNVFGAVSSHSSSNYAWRKANVDNSIYYRNDDVEAIMTSRGELAQIS